MVKCGSYTYFLFQNQYLYKNTNNNLHNTGIHHLRKTLSLFLPRWRLEEDPWEEGRDGGGVSGEWPGVRPIGLGEEE